MPAPRRLRRAACRASPTQARAPASMLRAVWRRRSQSSRGLRTNASLGRGRGRGNLIEAARGNQERAIKGEARAGGARGKLRVLRLVSHLSVHIFGTLEVGASDGEVFVLVALALQQQTRQGPGRSAASAEL